MSTNGHDTTAARSTDTGWQTHALCSQMAPELWFPEPWEDETLAKAVCEHCLVRAACLAYALDANEEHGVWGGLSAEERLEVRRRQGVGPRIAVALDAESEAA
jgi:WhiB family transcriptional regulator, redox-sensing transcriptional regulator